MGEEDAQAAVGDPLSQALDRVDHERVTDRGDEAALVQTRFALRLDDEFLYLAVVADEPDAGNLITTANQRDRGVWRDDCIELMIDPSGQRVEYFHFIVSANGAKRPSCITVRFSIRWIR